MDSRSQAASDRSLWTRVIRYWTDVPSGRLHLPETDPFADHRVTWDPNTPYRTRHRFYPNPNHISTNTRTNNNNNNNNTNARRTNRGGATHKPCKPQLTEEQFNQVCPTFAKRAHSDYKHDASHGYAHGHGSGNIDMDERYSVCSYISSQFPWTNDACPICLDDIHPGNRMKRLPCGHEFHADCITKWVCQTNKCPYCKALVKDVTECVVAEEETVQEQVQVQIQMPEQDQQQQVQSSQEPAIPMQSSIAIMI
mmetsp:Transcript_19995/g.34387  ORF Transcript_19995/g.34387 Transcript_19995/m.34387 type:complete len:253 (+) Transcript_19995:217-975(+)